MAKLDMPQWLSTDIEVALVKRYYEHWRVERVSENVLTVTEKNGRKFRIAVDEVSPVPAEGG